MADKISAFTRFLKFQVLIIGFIKMGEFVFFFFEQNYINLYVEQILGKSEYYVSWLVSLSAVMGIIFQFVWGVISDNTRSKYGRRRPFFIFGGFLAGISMIIYAFSKSYWLCLILDGIIIAIGTNAYLAAEHSLIPDIFEKKLRGRANGIIFVMGNIGMVIALALFLITEEIFGYEGPQGGTILESTGFILLLTVGGAFIIIGGILGFLFVREKPTDELQPRKTFKAEMKETFRVSELKNHKEFGKNILANMVFRIGYSTIMPFLFSYIFSLGMDLVELLISIMVVSFPLVFIFTYVIGVLSDKYGRKKFLIITLFIMALGLSLVPLIGGPSDYSYALILLCFPFIMITLLGFDAPMNSWTQDLLPENKRGQFIGIMNITMNVPQIIGSFIAGYVAIEYGKQWIFPTAGAFLILSIPFFLWIKDTLGPKSDPE
ncbi:MFS transporter [Promethearchaeum syntrophicum]|uniref:MFS transporter n=1 Tax=Promethearchaeum syntrophicum TaxID=2594042 RepID=A0A5B9DFC2_9ARCH|nr:MFS transporter [Candidatus Prometheoarchaeum syntrophicum]